MQERIYNKLKGLDYYYWLILIIGISAAIYKYGFSATLLMILILWTSFIIMDFVFWIPDFVKQPRIKYKALFIPFIVIILDLFFMKEWGVKMACGFSVVWILLVMVLRFIK